MTVLGTLLSVVVGALLTWFLTMYGRRDDRRRDAWAAWAEQAYRLMTTRRQIVDQCWADSGGLDGRPTEVRVAFTESLAARLVQEVERDPHLQSALARVLLAETSTHRRHQARAFTNLLSQKEVEDEPGSSHPTMVLRDHKRYLLALQLTLDNLLGRFAEVGTSTQVLAWFKQKYDQLGSKDEHMISDGNGAHNKPLLTDGRLPRPPLDGKA